MLGNPLRPPTCLTPASAALVSAEWEIQTPLHCVEKEMLPGLGLQW